MLADNSGFSHLEPPLALFDNEDGHTYIRFHSSPFADPEESPDAAARGERQRLLPFPGLPEFEEARLPQPNYHFLRVLVNKAAPALDQVMNAWEIHCDLIRLLSVACPLEQSDERGAWEDENREYTSGPISMDSRFDPFAGDWLVHVQYKDEMIWRSEAPDPFELLGNNPQLLSVSAPDVHVRNNFSFIREVIDRELPKVIAQLG